MNILKKIIINILLIFGLFGLFSFSNNSFADSWISYGDSNTRSIYENMKDGLTTGIKQVKDTISGIETEKSATEYVQMLVVYFLTFLSLIAIIYIIYAGINIMVAGSDEEKMKNQKKTIIHVIIGIIVIWLAYSIVITVFAWLGDKQLINSGGGTNYQQSNE